MRFCMSLIEHLNFFPGNVGFMEANAKLDLLYLYFPSIEPARNPEGGLNNVKSILRYRRIWVSFTLFLIYRDYEGSDELFK